MTFFMQVVSTRGFAPDDGFLTFDHFLITNWTIAFDRFAIALVIFCWGDTFIVPAYRGAGLDFSKLLHLRK